VKASLLRRALPLLVLAAAAAACTGSGASSSPVASAAPSAASPAAPSTAASANPSSSAGGPTVTVTGVEYAFEGAPDTTAPGTQFALKNGGKELHELVLVRKNADVTESWDDILKLPDDQALSKVTLVGNLMAEPGKDAEGTVTADQAGDYLMICFVPKGITELPTGSPDPNATPPAGEPHFLLGMRHEVIVK